MTESLCDDRAEGSVRALGAKATGGLYFEHLLCVFAIVALDNQRGLLNHRLALRKHRRKH